MGKRLGIPVAVAIALGIGLATLRSGGGVFPPFVFVFDAGIPGAPACGCQSVAAGSGGEVVSEVRDSGAYCTKNNWLNGIATGDLVLCGNDKLRVMSGDGASAPGFLSEVNTHNYNTSQIFNSVSWPSVGSGVAGPTVTINAGPCPDGNNTAARIQAPAVTSAQFSVIANAAGCPNGGVTSASAYVRGVSSGGSMTINFAGATPNAYAFTYSSGSWTRIAAEGVNTGGQNFAIGLDPPSLASPVAMGPSDFYLCFAQCETGDHATSFTATDRDIDRITANVMVPLGSDLQMSGTVLPEGYAGGDMAEIGFNFATNLMVESIGDGGLHCHNSWSSTDMYTPDAGNWLGPISYRTPFTFLCGWEPIPDALFGGATPDNWSGVVDACLGAACVDGGVQVSPLATVSGNTEVVNFGAHLSNVDFTAQPDGIIKGLTFTSQATKKIFAYGDSIVGGVHAAETFHNMLYDLRGAKTSLQNHAQSGWNSAQCRTAWEATIAGIKAHPQEARSTYMMVQCGTNSADDASGTVIDLESMYLEGLDAGVHILGSTITPRGDHCPFVAAVNSAIQAFGKSNNIIIADTYDPLWAGTGCDMQTQYQGDSIHPNDAGTVIMVNTWISNGGW